MGRIQRGAGRGSEGEKKRLRKGIDSKVLISRF